MIEDYINQRLQERDILLMAHAVVGYPDLETCAKKIAVLVDSGIDMIELQFPFSEPIADGPTILAANHASIAQKITTQQCLDFVAEMARQYSIPFLIMSYYNIMFAHGTTRFVEHMRDIGVAGAIVPDLPFEEGNEYLASMQKAKLDPIFIVAPTTSTDRMKEISKRACGFVYCVARHGVTGIKTELSNDLDNYLLRCRDTIHVPLGVGFGIQGTADIEFLKGKAQIAIVGSRALVEFDSNGLAGVGRFFGELLKSC